MTHVRKGLFLDYDGTLVESLYLIKEAYDRLLASYDKTGSEEEFHALAGPPIKTFLENILKNHDLSISLDIFQVQFISHLREVFQNITSFPYAIDLIKTASSHGYIVGIVTSNNKEFVEIWVRENALEPFISFIIDGENIKNGKPDPEPYLKALEVSECSKEHSLAVEDSLTGATSALSAGLPTALLASHIPLIKQEELSRSFSSLKIVTTLKDVLEEIK